MSDYSDKITLKLKYQAYLKKKFQLFRRKCLNPGGKNKKKEASEYNRKELKRSSFKRSFKLEKTLTKKS